MNVKINQHSTANLNTNTPDFPCKCCGGTGVQTLLTGECIICKACNGSGQWTGPPAPVWPWPNQTPYWEITYDYPPPNTWFAYSYC